jgi:hypothetical protein
VKANIEDRTHANFSDDEIATVVQRQQSEERERAASRGGSL